jgi:hypothetical protein
MIIDNFEELLKYIRKNKFQFIVIDGRDGAGKTSLGRNINTALGCTRLTETDFRYFDDKKQFKLDVKSLNDSIQSAVAKPIIFDSCLVQSYIKQMKMTPDCIIYVKCLIDGIWHDGESITTIEQDDSPLVKQIKQYHLDSKPEANSTIVYTYNIVTASSQM